MTDAPSDVSGETPSQTAQPRAKFAPSHPFVALDTSSLSVIAHVGIERVVAACDRDRVVLGIPMLAFAETLSGGDGASLRMQSILDLVEALQDRCTWLVDVPDAVAMDIGFAGAHDRSIEAGEFWGELLHDLRSNGIRPQVVDGMNEWLAKRITRSRDQEAREDFARSEEGHPSAAQRDAFVENLDARIHGDCAWAIDLLFERSEHEWIDRAYVLRSRYARMFVAWAHIQMLGAISEPGGRFGELFRGPKKGKNGWVDARIGTSSIEADVFLSEDNHQRLVFSVLSERLFGRLPLVGRLTEWVAARPIGWRPEVKS